MINSSDPRTNIFGASDTQKMLMGLNTKGFKEFWYVKTGEIESDFVPNKYTLAGDLLEEPVLKTIHNNMELSPVCRYNDYLRANLDGLHNDTIYEIKCCNYESVLFTGVKKDKWYRKQVQVQMFVSGIRKAKLCYYAVMPHEYETGFLLCAEIDSDRIFTHDIEYDKEWIEEVYLPRFEFLCKCIEDNVYPWEV